MKRVVLGLLLVSLITELLPALPLRSWVFEVIDNFALYFAFAHLAGLALMPWLRGACGKRMLFLTTFLLLRSLYSTLSLLVPFYRASPVPTLSCAKPEVLQVVLANVSSESPKAAELVQQLASRSRDIIALFETTERDVNGVGKDYPYKIFAHQVEGFGIGILSKLPFAGEPVLSMGGDLRSVAMVRPTLVSGRSFLLSAFDALPPFDNEALYLNWLLNRRMSVLLRHEAPTALVLTDLNATPFSGFYRGLLKDARLSDVMWGRGLERTWDMQSTLIRFALDHALVKGEIAVKEAQYLELLGSDHRGLEVTIEVCGEAAPT